jgi:hypothetical protein
MASLYNTVASHLKYPGRQMGIVAEDDQSFRERRGIACPKESSTYANFNRGTAQYELESRSYNYSEVAVSHVYLGESRQAISWI